MPRAYTKNAPKPSATQVLMTNTDHDLILRVLLTPGSRAGSADRRILFRLRLVGTRTFKLEAV
jgi:hypothetical protein